MILSYPSHRSINPFINPFNHLSTVVQLCNYILPRFLFTVKKFSSNKEPAVVWPPLNITDMDRVTGSMDRPMVLLYTLIASSLLEHCHREKPNVSPIKQRSCGGSCLFRIESNRKSKSAALASS